MPVYKYTTADGYEIIATNPNAEDIINEARARGATYIEDAETWEVIPLTKQTTCNHCGHEIDASGMCTAPPRNRYPMQ